jgi:hypothetical protein
MTTIFAIVLLTALTISASLLYVLLQNLSRRNRAKKLLHSFKEASTAFNLTITKQEILGTRMIGLDDTNNRLLFLEASSPKPNGYLIDLGKIESCTIENEYTTFNADSTGTYSAEAFVNTIALQLHYAKRIRPATLLVYDKAADPASIMRERAGQAKQWQALLSTRLLQKGDKVDKRKNVVKPTYAHRITEKPSFLRVAENSVVI